MIGICLDKKNSMEGGVAPSGSKVNGTALAYELQIWNFHFDKFEGSNNYYSWLNHKGW